MKPSLAALLALLTAGLLSSCNSEKTSSSSHDREETPPAPAGPSEEVLTALEAQPVGRKLLGRTMQFSNGKYVEADLRKAPEYYLVHFSASW